jgi:hypothetical protein
MASLLALLSHPSEIMGTEEGVTSQSIVFIIDEFDMFATHPRQTLLYNLFDVAQSRKAPIAVLGCTTRLDVVETLEKRVKSRFSHRYVYLNLPRNLPAYWQVCKQGLVVDKDDAEREGIDIGLEGYEEFRKYWNHKVEVWFRLPSDYDRFEMLTEGFYTGYVQGTSIPRTIAISLLHVKIADCILCRVDHATGFHIRGRPDAEHPFCCAFGWQLLERSRLSDASSINTVGLGPWFAYSGRSPGHYCKYRHGQFCDGIRRIQFIGK